MRTQLTALPAKVRRLLIGRERDGSWWWECEGCGVHDGYDDGGLARREAETHHCTRRNT